MSARTLAAEMRPRPVAGALPWALAAAALSVVTGLLLVSSPRVPLDIGLVLGGAVLIAWRPYTALLVLLLARVLHQSDDIFPAAISLTAGGLALAFAKRPRIPAMPALPLLLLLVVAAPGVQFTPGANEAGATPLVVPLLRQVAFQDLSTAAFQWLALGALLVTFCLGVWGVRRLERLHLLVGAVLVSAAYPIGYALKQYAAGDLQVRPGQSSSFAAVRGPFAYPNYLAYYLAVVIVIALVVWLESRRLPVRLAVGGLLAAAVASLFLTYTRGAWIGVGIAVLLLAVVRYRRLLVIALLLLPLAAFAFPTSVHRLQARFGDLSSRSANHSVNSWHWRTHQWDRMLPYGWKRPVTGQGYGSYERLTIREFGREDLHYTLEHTSSGQLIGFAAHNDYVKMFVETGFVGLALWVLSLTGFLVAMLRARRSPTLRPLATGMAAVVLTLMVMSVADNVQNYPLVLLVVAAVTGGLTGVAAEQRRPA